jgi:NADH:ubiquinone oxidoreductase subunit H
LLLGVAFIVIVERKLLGGLQLRTGPIFVGINGVVQTVVDGLKLLSKDVMWFGSAIVGTGFLILSLLIYYVMYVDVLVVLVVVRYFFMYGAMKSSNLYSLLGCYRSVVLMLSYDVVLLLLILYCYGFV